MPRPSLAIVLPCFNPQGGWTNTVIAARTKIERLLPDTRLKIIIVNDGSAQDLSEDFRLLKETIPGLLIESYAENKGKGFAVRRGVAIAEDDIIIYTDIDFPYHEEGLAEMYNALASGNYDVALATRDEHYYTNIPALRRVISQLLKKIIRYTLHVPTTDTQAGLKGFNRKGKQIFLRTVINRYLFDLEFVSLTAKEKNIRTTCITVQLKRDIAFSKMRWSVLLRETLNFLRILFR